MDLDSFRYYTAVAFDAYERQYDAVADPWQLIRVNPARVEYYNGEIPLHRGLGRIRNGEWDSDEHCVPIRETTLYRGLRQRFEEGRDWEATALVESARERFEHDESYRGYQSLDEFIEVRCNYIDDLYDRIRREGYRSNAEAGHEKASEDNPFEAAYANKLDPMVLIGRDGEVYWTEGNHRFAIASLLGIEEIPVYVLCRHEQWQRVRERVQGAPGSEIPAGLAEHADHPDLQDLQ